MTTVGDPVSPLVCLPFVRSCPFPFSRTCPVFLTFTLLPRKNGALVPDRVAPKTGTTNGMSDEGREGWVDTPEARQRVT